MAFASPRKPKDAPWRKNAPPPAPSGAFKRISAPRTSRRLDHACGVFGVGKSDLIRRLVRASLDIGPALSAENAKTLAATSKELRAIGRNIAQVVKGINLGYAPQFADDEALFRATHLALGEISSVIHEMTIAYGSRLRRSAELKPLAGKEPA